MPSTSRRTLLGTLAVGTVIGVAGCSSSCPDTGTPEPSHTVETADESGFDTLPSGAWPSPRFDTANTGYTPVEPPSPTPSVQWQTTVPTGTAAEAARGVGTPIVAGKTVVVTTFAGVFALSLHDGTERWRREVTPAVIESATGYGEELASPVAADGRVFCPTPDGVVALALNDGSVVWRVSDATSAGVPAVASDGLVVPTTEGLAMLDTRDGSRVWTDSAGARLPAVSDGTVVAAGEQTVAFDATTGERQWTASAESPKYPVVADGTVYLGTGDGLVGRALSDGSERWRIDRGRFLVPPVVTPESVYAVERPGEAGDATFAFDRVADAPPEPRWCSEVGEGAVTGAADGALFTLQDAGLVAFTADFGDAEWQYSPGGGIQPPAVLNGGAVSVSTDGVVAGIGGE
jgi:outer membrane protein assembly factor BamB